MPFIPISIAMILPAGCIYIRIKQGETFQQQQLLMASEEAIPILINIRYIEKRMIGDVLYIWIEGIEYDNSYKIYIGIPLIKENFPLFNTIFGSSAKMLFTRDAATKKYVHHSILFDGRKSSIQDGQQQAASRKSSIQDGQQQARSRKSSSILTGGGQITDRR